MKGIPKRKGLLIVALIAVMVITSGLPLAGTSYAADSSPGSSGAVGLSKEAVNVNDKINEWDITVKVNGSQQGRSSDIVIVMDRSRSMSYTDGTRKTRIEKAKCAAKDFVNQVLVAGSHTRIAVVTFDKTAAVVQDLTSSAVTLNKSIGMINADYNNKPKSAGGTNIQAGLHMAAELIEDSSADLKSVVLIGDGEPTHSFVFTGSVEAKLVSCTTADGGIHLPEWKVSNIDSAYDYKGQIVGFGDSYYITGPAFTIEENCPNDPDNVKHTFIYPSNHGIPSVYEAGLLGERRIRVYSVGIGVNDTGEAVLKDCTQNGGYLYINQSDSSYDFSGIADAIGTEAFNSVVTDPIGNMFELASAPTATRYAANTPPAYDPITRTITWNIGKLNPCESATMTYRVKAKAGVIFEGGAKNIYPNSGEYPTNGETSIRYQYSSGDPFTCKFKVPKVPLTGGAVTLKAVAVNSEGHLISSSGTEVEDYNAAQILKQNMFPEGENQYMVYGHCQVSMGAITGYEYKGWQYGAASGDSSEKTVGLELTTANPAPTVYFKYLKEDEPQLLYDVKVRYIDESDQSLIDEDTIVDQPAGTMVTAEKIDIYGYEFSGDQDSVKSCMVTKDTASNVITFYYTRKADYFTVRVMYLDENENSIDEERNKTYSAALGTTLTEEAIHFDNYVLAEGESSVKSVTITAPTLITFLYRHNAESRYNVTIKYLDGSGNRLHPDGYIYDKAVGTVVTAGAIAIENYKLTGSETTIKSLTVVKPNSEANPPIENVITFVYEAAGGGGDGGGGGGGGGSSDKAVTPAAIAPPALNKVDHFAYVVGYPDGEVKPLGTITREEVAVIFYRLMTEESRKQYFSTSQPFSDVEAKRWSNDEIATLYNAEIIQGNTDGSFEPSKPITRAEFAAIAAKFDKLEEVAENKFPDIENHWAKKYINSSAQKGWISGYGDGTFRPDNIIIRCEAMKMINEELDRRVDAAGLCSGTKQWPDNMIDKWYYEIVLEATNTHDYERENRPKSTEKWTKIKDNPVW